MNGKIERARVIELAESKVRAGKLSGAVNEYKKLLEGDSPDPAIKNTIGDLYIRLGRTEEALGVFMSAVVNYENRGQPSQALAICKKIVKLAPEHVESIIRLADLLGVQGYVGDARKEYLKAEQILKKEGRNRELIILYERLAGLDREDTEPRLALAELYLKEGDVAKGVAVLNETARLLIGRGNLDQAGDILDRIKTLKEDDERTIVNLIELLRKKDDLNEAIRLAGEFLDRNPKSAQLLNLLGTLFFEARNFKKAEEVFLRILEERPSDVKVRVMLGRIYVLQDKLDAAFALYEPLINSLVKKQKDDKAIGILGIILSARSVHTPSLEMLASIYKSRNEKNNLEVVNRVLLEEYRLRGMKEQMFVVLSELAEMAPADEEIGREYVNLKREFGFAEERKMMPETAAALEEGEGEESVVAVLAKADLYIQQGLLRNAKRILEILTQKHPDDERIGEKLVFLEKAKSEISDDELLLRVEKVAALEGRLKEKTSPTKEQPPAFREEEMGVEKVTAADIFAGIDLVPHTTQQTAEIAYYDVGERIQDELRIIRAVLLQQTKGRISGYEKELSDIVSDFRKQAQEKISYEDYDTHHHLGLAFLEQGLFDEAIDEFMLAAQEEERAFECCTLIAGAYVRKQDFAEASKWFEKCLEAGAADSNQLHAVEYELASIYEQMNETEKALQLFRKVQEWDPEYREVASRVKRLTEST